MFLWLMVYVCTVCVSYSMEITNNFITVDVVVVFS